MNPNTQMLKVTVLDAQHFSSDNVSCFLSLFSYDVHIFGFFKIPLKALLDQESREEWFTLQPVIKKNKEQKEEPVEEKPMTRAEKRMSAAEKRMSTGSLELGQLRIKVKYQEEVILPGPLYDELLEVKNYLDKSVENQLLIIRSFCYDKATLCRNKNFWW